jgi:DNA-binding transcriptional regulator YdaS (Cro superfamily)
VNHTRGMSNPVIDEVFQKAGGRETLRKSLGLSKQTMSDWKRSGEVPVRHCPAVHALTRIPLTRLNPAFDVKAADIRQKAKAG